MNGLRLVLLCRRMSAKMESMPIGQVIYLSGAGTDSSTASDGMIKGG